MSAAVSVPWSSILSDVSASLDDMTSLSSAEILKLPRPHVDVSGEFHSSALREGGCSGQPWDFSIPEQDAPSSRSDTQEKRLPNVADWKGTLDLITGMADVAEDQRNDLEQKTEAQQRALEDLRRELYEAQQRLRASEQRASELQARADSRLQEVQADLDAQVEVIRAETEVRVRAIRAQNDGLIRAAGERVRAAELRAQTAEAWLKRIDTAAKNLLLNGHMNRAGT